MNTAVDMWNLHKLYRQYIDGTCPEDWVLHWDIAQQYLVDTFQAKLNLPHPHSHNLELFPGLQVKFWQKQFQTKTDTKKVQFTVQH